VRQLFVGLKLDFAVCGRGQEPFNISFIVLLPVAKLLHLYAYKLVQQSWLLFYWRWVIVVNGIVGY